MRTITSADTMCTMSVSQSHSCIQSVSHSVSQSLTAIKRASEPSTMVWYSSSALMRKASHWILVERTSSSASLWPCRQQANQSVRHRQTQVRSGHRRTANGTPTHPQITHPSLLASTAIFTSLFSFARVRLTSALDTSRFPRASARRDSAWACLSVAATRDRPFSTSCRTTDM